jgi:magnesium transporter
MLKICLIFGLLILQIVSLQKFLKNLESICYFNQRKDIEISSHYLKSNGQLSFNFSIPNYNSYPFKEEEIFIIIKEVVFYFLSSEIDKGKPNKNEV